MPPAKKYPVKLKLPRKFLETLPVFEPPKPKSRAKKIAAEEKKAAASSKPSPVPSEDAHLGKLITGPKELSTAGLTVNSAPQALDKSGRPCRKWTKSSIQFKAFSGFKVEVGTWKRDAEAASLKTENSGIPGESGTVGMSTPAEIPMDIPMDISCK